MNALLTGLGVPSEVQQFFNADELIFNYGGHFEQFEPGCHRVPTTAHLWFAGNLFSREVVITHSAMEAICYLTVNRHKYAHFHALSFVALGNLPNTGQLKWIRQNLKHRKFTLAFGNDLLGRIADIRVATGLQGLTVNFDYTAPRLGITCRRVLYHFEADQLTLHNFELAAGIRSRCRTVKPVNFISFLDQLKYDANP